MSVYDTYDFIVTPTSSKQQLWESTGVGSGVRPVRYTYENVKVVVFTRGGEKVGFVAGSASFREGQREPLRDSTCETNFALLASRHPDLRGVLIVTGSFLEEVVRGKGVGLAMYRVLAEHAGKQGLAVVPEYCWSGTALTSKDALRVWGKLAREPGVDAEGHTVYAPSARSNPRRRRAPHPQVSTPAFKRWFGNSRVVDAEGQPLVMYHGTSVANFDAFSTLRPPFFTSDKNYAKMYSDKGKGGKAREVEVFLRIERPFDTRHDAQAVRLFNADFLPWYREQQQRYAHLRERDIPPVVLGEALPFPSADDFWRYLRIRSRRGDTPYDGLVVDEGSFPATWEEATERKLTLDAQYAWVPLDPTQIKSAKKNVGTFDPDDPSILRNPRRRRAPHPQVSTPAFQRWFGDSKVVDDAGNPRVVYHGTCGDFSVFDPERADTTAGTGVPFGTFFFTSVPEVADTYARDARRRYCLGGNIMPVYLSLQDPLIVDLTKWAHAPSWNRIPYRNREWTINTLTEHALRRGYDGLIVKGLWDTGLGKPRKGRGVGNTYVAFGPEQIKSAIGNRGTFDPDDPDITRNNPRRRR